MTNTKNGTRFHGANDPTIQADMLDIPLRDAVRARIAYAGLPDIRMDKVLDIRRRMDAGLYRTSAEELADAILCSASNALLCN